MRPPTGTFFAIILAVSMWPLLDYIETPPVRLLAAVALGAATMALLIWDEYRRPH